MALIQFVGLPRRSPTDQPRTPAHSLQPSWPRSTSYYYSLNALPCQAENEACGRGPSGYLVRTSQSGENTGLEPSTWQRKAAGAAYTLQPGSLGNLICMGPRAPGHTARKPGAYSAYCPPVELYHWTRCTL